MTKSTSDRLRDLATFNLHEYQVPGFEHVPCEYAEGARRENARLKPALLAAAECIEQFQHIADHKYDRNCKILWINLAGCVSLAKESIAKLNEVLGHE